MSLHERLKVVIESNTNATKRFKELEQATGIASATWKTYLTRGVRPSADLVEAVAKSWPKYAFWMVTGIDDGKFGHTAPPGHGFPHEGNPQQADATSMYFLEAISANSVFGDLVHEFFDETEQLPNHELDFGKRNVEHLVDESSPKRSDIVEAKSRLKVLNKLRWLDLLLDTYMPKFGYEESEIMVGRISKSLRILEDNARNLGMHIDMQPIWQKLALEHQHIKKWSAWKAGASSDD